jgi:hypothetical protein
MGSVGVDGRPDKIAGRFCVRGHVTGLPAGCTRLQHLAARYCGRKHHRIIMR